MQHSLLTEYRLRKQVKFSNKFHIELKNILNSVNRINLLNFNFDTNSADFNTYDIFQLHNLAVKYSIKVIKPYILLSYRHAKRFELPFISIDLLEKYVISCVKLNTNIEKLNNSKGIHFIDVSESIVKDLNQFEAKKYIIQTKESNN